MKARKAWKNVIFGIFFFITAIYGYFTGQLDATTMLVVLVLAMNEFMFADIKEIKHICEDIAKRRGGIDE